jgi:hypothetical protein
MRARFERELGRFLGTRKPFIASEQIAISENAFIDAARKISMSAARGIERARGVRNEQKNVAPAAVTREEELV